MNKYIIHCLIFSELSWAVFSVTYRVNEGVEIPQTLYISVYISPFFKSAHCHWTCRLVYIDQIQLVQQSIILFHFFSKWHDRIQSFLVQKSGWHNYTWKTFVAFYGSRNFNQWNLYLNCTANDIAQLWLFFSSFVKIIVSLIILFLSIWK